MLVISDLIGHLITPSSSIGLTMIALLMSIWSRPSRTLTLVDDVARLVSASVNVAVTL